MQQSSWTPDSSQQRVLSAGIGYHLVLAPPGCGKTQLLAERVAIARLDGIDYSDMLCLTFTNRAARGMYERLQSRLCEDYTNTLFVGNVHRFCSKFLFDNNLVAAESAVIDDDDAISILARYIGEDEEKVLSTSERRKAYNTIIQLSHLMHQIAAGHPKEIRAHTDAISADDIQAMKTICGMLHKEFTAQTAIDIYQHAITYEDIVASSDIDMGKRHIVGNMLYKMKYAHAYEAYKKQNALLDFEDLLILSYDALTETAEHHKYRWIQIDEVQDLNFLQLAIIDLVTAPDATVVYLGDTQQAIFSFMGAKMDTVEMLKKRCSGNICHLDTNHRSPSYLLDIFNTYASQVMGIDKQLLPKAANTTTMQGNELSLIRSGTTEEEQADVARLAATLFNEHRDETTAIIVNANRDADAIGEVLDAIGTPHFKVSGTDIFSSDNIKLLLAHYSVVANEFNFMAWARVIKGFGIQTGNAAARALVRNLRIRAMLPSDLLSADGMSYVERFAEMAGKGELVVFDTETTGLDVYNDDIIQIAAIKMRNGKIVPSSGISLYIDTDKEIPAMLGDIENPMIEERRHHELLPPDKALSIFLEYAGTAPLLAHNATFDYDIMLHNMSRHLPHIDWQARHPLCFDSLKLARLLFPGLVRYKLKHLIMHLGLEGENSHLADDDVFATCGLVGRCLEKAKEYIPEQKRFMQQPDIQQKAELLRHRYLPYLQATLSKLHDKAEKGRQPSLVDDMSATWQRLVDDGYAEPIGKATHIFNFLAKDMMAGEEHLSVRQLLDRHVVEINTLREADLCGGTSMNERLFISTIHKAKGLEFDNVIVYDVVEGRYPNYYNANIRQLDDEDARKLYVAITRARKRLCISVSTKRIRFNGMVTPISPSRFLIPVVDKLTN